MKIVRTGLGDDLNGGATGQSLLGIHMRLLTLKKQMVVRHEDITQEIATTQRLVEDAVKTINQFAHELGIPHEI